MQQHPPSFTVRSLPPDLQLNTHHLDRCLYTLTHVVCRARPHSNSHGPQTHTPPTPPSFTLTHSRSATHLDRCLYTLTWKEPQTHPAPTAAAVAMVALGANERDVAYPADPNRRISRYRRGSYPSQITRSVCMWIPGSSPRSM
jgi:hypothetical protein